MQETKETEGCMRPTASRKCCRTRNRIGCRVFSIMSIYPVQNKKRAERDAVRPIRSVSGICTFFAPPGNFGTRIGEGGGCAARKENKCPSKT